MSDRWNIPRITLFHGTVRDYGAAIIRDGIDVFKGQPNVDFGTGFYTTTWLEQAQEWAEKRATDDGSHGPPAIVQMEIDRRQLCNLRSMAFVRIFGDYWKFVSHCRWEIGEDPLTKTDFDVVYGPVMKSLWPDLEIFFGMDQISFHSVAANTLLRNQKACKVELI